MIDISQATLEDWEDFFKLDRRTLNKAEGYNLEILLGFRYIEPDGKQHMGHKIIAYRIQK